MGNFCDASTLVCACSSTRCCWMSSLSSTVGGTGAGAPNCACNARTCSESARFSCSSRSSRSRILARSGAVCAHKETGARQSMQESSLAGCHDPIRGGILPPRPCVEIVSQIGAGFAGGTLWLGSGWSHQLVRPAIEKLLQFAAHQRRRKRFWEKRFYSQRHNPLGSCRVGIGADDDDRHIRKPLVRPHTADQLVPIHARHI